MMSARFIVNILQLRGGVVSHEAAAMVGAG